MIETAVEKYGLIKSGDKILVGFSGGADSVCLLSCLWERRERYNIEVAAAHLNHCLRGVEADADEEFCRKFCQKRGIRFFSRRADVKAYAKEKSISEETAGREIRYAFFEELLGKYGMNKIATAHHKNDLAETIVMNFIRGAGINGLSGIPPVRGCIIRPLICTKRSEIEEYCRENKLEYVTDKTNFESVYRRNKVRLELIPYITESFNSGFVDCIAENAENISQDSAFLERLADKEYKSRIIRKNGTLYIDIQDDDTSIRRRLIMRMAAECGVKDLTSSHIHSVDELWRRGETGKSVNLPCGVEAGVSYGRLYMGKPCDNVREFEYHIQIGERTEIPEAGVAVTVVRDDKGSFALDGELVIRSRRSGDIFYPSGMKGKKKVKEYFVNEKIPSAQRLKIPILECNGEIAYIIGKRRDRRFFGKGYNVIVEKLSD